MCNLIQNYFDYNNGFLIRKKKVRGKGTIGEPVGTLAPNGYLIVSFFCKRLYVHRMIWEWHYGEPTGLVDHINSIKTDNRIENLRHVDHSTNRLNQNDSLRSDNTSGYRGVCWTGHNWKARITVNGKVKQIGVFNSKKEAALAYKQEASKL